MIVLIELTNNRVLFALMLCVLVMSGWHSISSKLQQTKGLNPLIIFCTWPYLTLPVYSSFFLKLFAVQVLFVLLILEFSTLYCYSILYYYWLLEIFLSVLLFFGPVLSLTLEVLPTLYHYSTLYYYSGLQSSMKKILFDFKDQGLLCR